MTTFLAKKFKTCDEEYLVTQQKALQILIGVLGIFIPLLLYVFLYLDIQYAKPLQSISHYYFTRVSAILVIGLSLLAFFLLIYKGKHDADDTSKINWDAILSNLAGLGALTLLLFPTSNIDPASPGYVCSVTTLKAGHAAAFRVSLHYISAAIYLLSLAGISFFVFTKTHSDKSLMTSEKKIRNVFYRIFGLVMAVAIVVAFMGTLGWIHIPLFGESLTFWMETIAVECFGFSWLIKAEVFLKDKVHVK
jgi:uncharacterized protein YacL